MVGFLSFLFLLGIAIFTLYKLHRKHIIEVRIPKRFRVGCFKNYISPEELKAIEDERIRMHEIKMKEELVSRLAMQPTEKGYKIEDSWFGDQSENPDFEVNPNQGLEIEGDVIVDIFKNSEYECELSGNT